MNQDPKPKVKVFRIDRSNRRIYFGADPSTINAFRKYGEITANGKAREGAYIMAVHSWFAINDVANYVQNYQPEQ